MKRIFIILIIVIFGSLSLLAQEKYPPIVDPDSYPASSFKELKPVLDNVAEEWQKKPDTTIYLIVYGKSSPNKSKIMERLALKRLKESRVYLKNKYKIPPEKIVAVFGGTQIDLEMRIFLIKEGSESLSVTLLK